MADVRVCSAAETEFTDALCWYAKQSRLAGLEFESEFAFFKFYLPKSRAVQRSHAQIAIGKFAGGKNGAGQVGVLKIATGKDAIFVFARFDSGRGKVFVFEGFALYVYFTHF